MQHAAVVTRLVTAHGVFLFENRDTRAGVAFEEPVGGRQSDDAASYDCDIRSPHAECVAFISGTSTHARLSLLAISASRIVNWRRPSTNCGYSGVAVGSSMEA